MTQTQILKNCKIGKDTRVYNFVNLYGCFIGDNCVIGSFVEIQNGVKIGHKVKIESHAFICEGVTIEDNVFIGHHVVFTNDKYPKSVTTGNNLMRRSDWKPVKTTIKKGASIGSNATILPGITIGENAVIGAGSVDTENIPAEIVVYGNPAHISSKK